MSRTRDMTNLSAEQKATLDNLKSSKNPTYLIYIESNIKSPHHTDDTAGFRFSNKTFIFQDNIENAEGTFYFSNVPITIGNLKDSINYETKTISPNTLQVSLSNVYYPEGLNDNYKFTEDDIKSGNAVSKNYLSDYIFRNKKELNLVQDEIDYLTRDPESLIGHRIEIFLSTGNDTYIDNADNARLFSDDFDPVTPRSKISSVPLFKGYIDKVNVTLNDIKISCKDASYKLYDANFPIEGNSINNTYDRYLFTSNYLGADDFIPEKYRDKPIPATYGMVESAPTSIINLKKFDEFLSLAYNNFDSTFYSDIDIVSDNRKHFYIDSLFDMGSSYLYDRGYLKIPGNNMYALVRQYNSELMDEPDNSPDSGGIFGEALSPTEGKAQYDKKSGKESSNNYFSILTNNPIVALDFLELSFFNYPDSVSPYARSKETTQEAENGVLQPTHTDFIVEMGNQLYTEGSETTEVDMSPLYDGNAFTKIEYATIDIPGGDDYPSTFPYSASDIGCNKNMTISGFRVKFKPTGISTNYHLAFPLYKLGLNRHIELLNNNQENWYGTALFDGAMESLFKKRASNDSAWATSFNRTTSIKTTQSMTDGSRGIEFIPLTEQLDLYDGIIPGDGSQEADEEHYGSQYACLVPNNQIQPRSYDVPRWLAHKDNADLTQWNNNKKHFVFDNYHSWNWLNLNKNFNEAYGYNILNLVQGTRLRADMGAAGYGSEDNLGGITKNFVLSHNSNVAFNTHNSWDWTKGADDFLEFYLGCDMMITDVHKFELYNFMIFHIGATQGIEGLDYYVNTYGRETTNVITDSTRPIYRLYVNPHAENTCRFIDPKLYNNTNGVPTPNSNPYFYNGIPNSWQYDFEPFTTNMEDGASIVPMLNDAIGNFFHSNNTYYHAQIDYGNFALTLNFLKTRYTTAMHRLMNRAQYENIVGSIVEDELGNRMRILKVHYDKYLKNMYTNFDGSENFDFYPALLTELNNIHSGWTTAKDDFSWNRNMVLIPDCILVDVEMIEGTPHVATELINDDETLNHPIEESELLNDYFKEELYLPMANAWKDVVEETMFEGFFYNEHQNPEKSIRVNKDGFGDNEEIDDNYENRVFRYQHSYKLSDGILTKPADIVNDILFQEYKLDNFEDVYSSKSSTEKSREYHTNQDYDIGEWDLAFSVTDKTKISTLLTDISLNSKSFTTYSTSTGSIKYPTIKDFYTPDEPHYTVNPNNTINFKYQRTREEDVKSSISLSYKKDYSSGGYTKTTDKYTIKDFVSSFSAYEDAYKKYYGISDNEDLSKNFISFNSDFIRSDETAREFCRYNLMQRMNQRIIVDFQYQLFDDLFDIECGDIIRFTSKPNNQNIYGVDITTITELNSQLLYPFFMILSVEKDTSKCQLKIKAIQLHSLIHKPSQAQDFATAFPPSSVESPDDFVGIPNLPLSDDDDTDPVPVFGCTDETANGIGPNDEGLPEDTGAYNPDATEDDGSCQYHPPMGDVNFDGTVNVLDVVIMINAILTDIPGGAEAFLTEDQYAVADLNGDNTIDILDIVSLINIVLED